MTCFVNMYHTHRTSICSATSRDTKRLRHIAAVSRTFRFSAGNLDISFAAASLPSRVITTGNIDPMSKSVGIRSHSSSVRNRSASMRIISIFAHSLWLFSTAIPFVLIYYVTWWYRFHSMVFEIFVIFCLIFCLIIRILIRHLSYTHYSLLNYRDWWYDHSKSHFLTATWTDMLLS